MISKTRLIYEQVKSNFLVVRSVNVTIYLFERRDLLLDGNKVIYIAIVDMISTSVSLDEFDRAKENIITLIALLELFKASTSKINGQDIDMLIKDISALDPEASNIKQRLNFTKDLIANVFNNLK